MIYSTGLEWKEKENDIKTPNHKENQRRFNGLNPRRFPFIIHVTPYTLYIIIYIIRECLAVLERFARNLGVLGVWGVFRKNER